MLGAPAIGNVVNHNRFDLKVLIASLLAAGAVIGVFLVYEQSVQRDKTLERATSAARLLRSMPFTGLAPGQRQAAYTELLQHLSQDTRFAYAQISDGQGNKAGEKVAPGIAPPDLPARATPLAGWVDRIDLPNLAGRGGFELRGPLSGNQEGRRYRLAYLEPTVWEVTGSVSYLAALILPIFSLVPLLLLLLRREIRPIKGLARSISRQKLTVEPRPVDDISGFVEQFNGFLDQAQRRIDTYQKERDTLVTTERFLNYRVLKLESILHAMNCGIAIVDSNGKVTFCNELFTKYTALSADTITGLVASNWEVAEEFSALKQVVQMNSAPSGKFPDIEPAHMPGLTLRLTTQNIRKPNSVEHSGQVVVLTDVSGEALAQKSRGEFVGHVAHELKTPLNTLGLCVQSLQGSDGEDQEIRSETLNIASDEIERLATLISNLLSITQLEMGNLVLEPTRVKLSDLLNDAVSSVSRAAGSIGRRFSVKVEDGLDTVQVDKPLFRIALNNLLTNAVKYSSENGLVQISAAESADGLEISVTDNGIGIPEAERESIFEKFSRGKSAEVSERSGHGLGLALTRDIVELHHGSIRVQSELGKGSRFTIELIRDSGVLRTAL